MKQKFSSRYQKALLAYLKRNARGTAEPARGWRQQALKAGLRTLDLAKLHEHILVNLVLPNYPARKRAAVAKRAGTFFTAAMLPDAKTQRGRDDTAHLNKIVGELSKRTVELAASNLALQLEIVQRKAMEVALKKSEHHYSRLLAESDRLQQQLRQLSRQVLSAQEEERKLISRELHDVIAQTLTGINVRLSALAKEATTNIKGLDRNIAKTQRLVEKSVNIVHQFARELRPAVLDDLGLIPALHSFMKHFTTRTGVRTHLTAFAGLEQLDTARRTVLFRVALEALTNVGRHAKASRAEVSIQKLPGCICMKINDDGKSFRVQQTLQGEGRKRLGLLGMRERLEMVGGRFGVESIPGKGTTIMARVPFGKAGGRKKLTENSETKS